MPDWKRWRAWLRAVHRDFGYVAVGFTVIYALSGLAINHIKDWDPNFHTSQKSFTISPIPDDATDDQAAARVASAAGLGTPDDVYRAGDEVRLGYSDGTQVTAIGQQVTVQARSPRFFLRVANWLHYNRGKRAWTYVADIYAVMLLYLAISGLFMIKGRLGLRWRGAILVSAGILVPLGYVVWSGGPEAKSGERIATAKSEGELRPLPPDPPAPAPAAPAPAAPATASAPALPPGVIHPQPPDPPEGAGSAVVVPPGVIHPLPPDPSP